MTVSESLKSRILAAIPLAQVVSEHVNLTERSGLKVGCCPFHEERSASFTVYPDHYFCFGCRENGDAITFVRKLKGMGFIDALKFLGEKAGVDTSELDQQRSDQIERRAEANLYRALAYAQDFFVKRLESPQGAKIRAYLLQRGFSEAAIKEYAFGYALDEQRALTDDLIRQRFNPREVEACSLASPSSKNGQLYDFFRNRLTIPIRDVHGRLVGFGGRAMDDFPPKYKNSRESMLFDKSSLLFGFDKARDFIRKGEPAIVVEGYMDVLQLWQSGFRGAVACMGTALKTQHLRQLSNVTSRVYLLFDGDAAGQKASLSFVSTALEFPRLDVRVAVLPSGEDPDTFVQKLGAAALQSLLEKSDALLDAGIKQKLGAASGVETAEVVRKDILPWLLQTTDPIRQEVLLNRVSFLSGIGKDVLTQEIRALRSTKPAFSKSPALLEEKTRHPRQGATALTRPLNPLEYDLLGQIYWAKPGELPLDEVKSFAAKELELDQLWLDFIDELTATLAAGGSPRATPPSAWSAASSPQAMSLIESFLQREAAFLIPNRIAAFERLKSEYMLKKRMNSVTSLRSQLSLGGEGQTHEILTAIRDLNKEIAALEKAKK